MEIYQGETLLLRKDLEYDLVSVSTTDPFSYTIIDQGVCVTKKDSKAEDGTLQIEYIKAHKRRIVGGLFTYREFMDTQVDVVDNECILKCEYAIRPPITSIKHTYDGYLLEVAIELHSRILERLGKLQAYIEDSYFEIAEDFLDGNMWNLSICFSSDKPSVDLVLRGKQMLVRHTLSIENS